MSKSTAWLSGVLLSCASAGASAAQGDVLFSIGQRWLDEDYSYAFGTDRHMQIGVMADFQLGGTPVYLSVSTQYSFDSDSLNEQQVTNGSSYSIDIDTDVGYFDAAVGIKVMPTSGVFRPYIGAGVATMGFAYIAEGSVSGDGFFDEVDEDDSAGAFGGYVNAGALLRFGGFVFGLEARKLWGDDFEFDDSSFEISSDALSVVALIGYGWGRPPASSPASGAVASPPPSRPASSGVPAQRAVTRSNLSAVTLDSAIEVRDRPMASASRLASLQSGESVRVGTPISNSDGTWVYVEADSGARGWTLASDVAP